MNNVDVINLQRKHPVDLEKFRHYSETLVKKVSEAKGKTFSTAFISDRRMKELNQFFRGKDSTTDVLSFPYEPDEFLSEPGTVVTGDFKNPLATASGSDKDFIGDIVISAEQAAKQAHDNGLTLEDEFRQLILHGLLHLCGYDHETDGGEMNARELELRDKLRI